MPVKAVILAGGKGTRLGNLTKDVPKPMLKIGDKAILEHQVLLLKRYGIKNIIIITNHLYEVIEDYFGDGKRFGVNISYFREKKPLGTTGGLKEIESQIDDDFILLYGDVMLDMNLKSLIDFHKKKKGTATLVLHPNDHPYDSDLVEINDDNKIVEFYPKPHDKNKYYQNLVNSGIYIMSKKILDFVEKDKKSDFGRELLPRIYKKAELYGYISAEYIKDIGAADRLEAVNTDYNGKKIQRLNNENKRPAIFLDRDGTINKVNGMIHKVEDLKLLPKTSEAIKSINGSDFLAIVITNQPVVARNLCSIDDVKLIHKKMESLLGNEGAYLDAIYFCPHHPDKGYPEENKAYKIDCNCRKPKTGMIKKAVSKFNIDLSKSFLVGDHDRDIECGKNANVKTVFVKTGELKDPGVKPDFIFDNLYEAVYYITNNHKS